VLETLSAQPPKRPFPVGELIIDFLLGCCTTVALFFLAFTGFAIPAQSAAGTLGTLFLCGIFCAIGIAYFVLGYLRGQSEGALLLKALCICGMTLIVTWTLHYAIAGTSILSTILGVWLRRHRLGQDWRDAN